MWIQNCRAVSIVDKGEEVQKPQKFACHHLWMVPSISVRKSKGHLKSSVPGRNKGLFGICNGCL